MSMFQSAEIKELAAAIVAAQGEFEAVDKDRTGKISGEGKRGVYEYSYTYAALPSVVEYASPILLKHGLAVIQTLGMTGNHDTLTTRLLHVSGEYIEDTMRLHLPKEDPQGHGSATTYARRYAYMAILGLVADDDDEGEAASHGEAPRNRSAPRTADSEGNLHMGGPVPYDAPQENHSSDMGGVAGPKLNEGMNRALYALCVTHGLKAEEQASRILRRRISDTRNLPQDLTKRVLDALNEEGIKFPPKS